MSSLSLEPPMVLVCLNKTSETQAAILKAGAFCVNILAEAQQDLAYQFAGQGRQVREHRLRARASTACPCCAARWRTSSAVSRRPSPAARTPCSSGHVAVAAGHEGAPLTYFRGRFGRLESVREEEAYARGPRRGC